MNKSMNEQLPTLAQNVARSTISVCDAMAARGAVKGEEMKAIGELREGAEQILAMVEMMSDGSDEFTFEEITSQKTSRK